MKNLQAVTYRIVQNVQNCNQTCKLLHIEGCQSQLPPCGIWNKLFSTNIYSAYISWSTILDTFGQF